MTAEAIDELTARGYPIYYGAMGENLTTRGLDRRLLRAGQQFRVGSGVIELTNVRAPCSQQNVYGASLQAEVYGDARGESCWTSLLPRCMAMSGFYDHRLYVPG